MADKPLPDSHLATPPGRDWRGLVIAGALALVLCFAATCLKARYSVTMRPFNPASDLGYYWSESAMQYRYARLVAQGVGIPDLDVDAEAPEGVRTAQELTLVMERVTGAVYKWVSRVAHVPFHVFLLYFYACFSSLAVLAFFVAAWQLTRSPGLSVAATAAYAFAPASWARFIGSYVYEGFALPFLFLCIAAIFGAIESQQTERRRIWVWSIIAASSLAIGLGSWHFSRFFFLVLVAAFIGQAWFEELPGRTLLPLLSSLAVGATCAGLGFPVLRANGFLLSPGLAVLWVLTLTLAVGQRFGWGRTRWASCFVLSCLAAGGILLLLGGHDQAPYGHVYSLFSAKLAHLLQKPPDPSVLSWDARTLWVDPFDSPMPGQVFFYFFPIALLVPALALGTREQQTRSSILLYALAAGWLILYLLISRLAGIAFFFIALLGTHALARSERRGRVLLGAALLVAFTEAAKALTINSPANLVLRAAEKIGFAQRDALAEDANIVDVLSWVRQNTKSDDRLVGGVGMSPVVLAYTQRPIVLQPKFESLRTRQSYVAFLQALFGSEEELFKYCADRSATYLLYQSSFLLDDTSDGERYAANALNVGPQTAAYILHFRPETLKRFQLVHQNADFRVFRVVRGEPRAEKTFRRFPQSVYLRASFGGQESEGLHQGDASSLRMRLLRRKRALQAAQSRRNHGDNAAAASYFQEALAQIPDDSQSWQELGQISFKNGDIPGAESAFRRAVNANPNSLSAHELLGDILLARGDYRGARPVLERAAQLDEENTGVLNNLGAALAKTGELRRSLEVLRRARRLSPSDEDVARNLKLVESALNK